MLIFPMTQSIMKSKFPIILAKYVFPCLFWSALWQILALTIDNSFLLPDIPETFSSLFSLMKNGKFYLTITFSLARVTIGLFLGIIVGIGTAILCHRSKIAAFIITPIISVIKSTPVASFIVLLWVIMSGDLLSIFIAFLMVVPIIVQNLLDGFEAIDSNLSEVADVFRFSRAKRFRLLAFPTLKKFLAPAVVTAVGLAWKAEIAAEIIAYTKKSIGQGINDAKYSMDTATVFAWTVVIIFFSLCLEIITKKILRRIK